MTKVKSILDFAIKKQAREKISVITCYDYTSALIAAAANIDCVLVGDSLAMTMHGHETTIKATVSHLAMHTDWVVRGLKDGANGEKPTFVIADMPFLSFRRSLSENIDAALEIMQAGANALKIEGAKGNLELISHLVDSGVPIMGHLGLTPQSVNQFGGFKVQGKTDAAHIQTIEDAKALEEAGCFAMVLECVPSDLGKEVSDAINIPTIGIGAGKDCDGQVLVWQDLLGLNPNFRPKFVRQYANGYEVFKNALNQYDADVKSGAFPNEKESF